MVQVLYSNIKHNMLQSTCVTHICLLLCFQLLTAWSLTGLSGTSATSPAVKVTPSELAWSSWSHSLGVPPVLKPFKEKDAKSESVKQKQRRRKEKVKESEEEMVKLVAM